MIRSALSLALVLAASSVRAAAPEVTDVEVSKPDMGWEFEVTLRHPDTGWDHFADGWEVLAPNGKRLGYRELTHPHVHEQPFTRSLRGVMIPDGVRVVLVRGRCSAHGWADEAVRVELEPSGRGGY